MRRLISALLKSGGRLRAIIRKRKKQLQTQEKIPRFGQFLGVIQQDKRSGASIGQRAHH
jgi:hypothetical protein